jgi:putative nucleotidyltransferase with HDIG domain
MSLSLPLDTIFDIITDAVLQEVALDITAVYAEVDGKPLTLRKRKSRIPNLANGILDRLEWAVLRDEFDGDRSILANRDDARKFFRGAPEIEGLLAIPLRIRNQVIGALVGVSATRGQYFHEGERRLLSILAGRTAAAIDNFALYENLQTTFTSTIEGLVSALEAKDEYTAGHSQRVARWAEIIARLAGLSETEISRIRKAALLHDIGKIGVNETALTKADKLTPEEFEAFKSHPSVGRKILEPLQFLGPIVGYVHYHHERFDGLGYPAGLKGEDIPLGARILCLADSFEVMSTDRAYRKRLPREIALAELRRCAGSQFDPHLASLLVDYLERFPDFREAMTNPQIGEPPPKIEAALS